MLGGSGLCMLATSVFMDGFEWCSNQKIIQNTYKHCRLCFYNTFYAC